MECAPILIVDDNDETRYLLRRILGMKGYPTTEARNGIDALRYLQAGHPASLVILDVDMPGMDGHQVHASMKADPKLAHIPIIMFSALSADGPVEDIVAYVRKGVDPDALLTLVAQACRRD